MDLQQMDADGRIVWTKWGDEWKVPDQIEPGMVLKTADGKVYLVGDVNKQGGLCNCCEMEADWIEAYAVGRWVQE